MSAPSPLYFDDSLEERAAPLRFRQVGSPYAFLNSIGIDPIIEKIYKGANIVDVAKSLRVSITVLLNWLEAESYMQKIEDATKFSAEGYLSESITLLREARTDFDLKKADKIASHGRFLASKLDKAKYGADNKHVGNYAGVTFIMHMGNGAPKTVQLSNTPQPTQKPKELSFIEGDYTRLAGFVTPTPEGVCEPEDLGPFEAPLFVPDEQDIPAYLREDDIDND